MKKKITKISLFFIFFLLCFFNSKITCTMLIHASTLLGDVNGNGLIDITDVRLLAKYIINNNIQEDIITANADYNNDGSIKLNDTVMILKDIYNNTPNGIVAFIPTQLDGSNQSIIFKSANGDLALLDTAEGGYQGDDNNICKKIEDYVHTYAGIDKNSPVSLKYLIISHAHGDHIGCLRYLLEGTDKINIENIVMKNESTVVSFKSFTKETYKNDETGGALYNYVKDKKDENTNLIITNNMEEDSIINLGSGNKTIKLHLYNVADIYANEPRCWSGTNLVSGKSIGFHAYVTGSGESALNARLILDGPNNTKEYPYMEYANSTTISYTNEFTINQFDTNGAHSKFYAFKRSSNYIACNSNANSIAILMEVPIENGDMRYLYFPSDLENNGYSHTGLTSTIEGKPVTLTAAGTNYFYQYDIDNDSFILENGALVPDTEKTVLYPQEYLISLAISKKIDTSKLILYQASHHGYNVDKASINLLNINRDNIYVVLTSETSSKDALDHYHVRTYYYTLNNVPKIGITDEIGYGLYYVGKYTNTDNGILEFGITNSGSVNVKTTK